MERGLPAAFTWDTQYSTVASGVVTVISTSTSRGSVDTFVSVGFETRAAEEGEAKSSKRGDKLGEGLKAANPSLRFASAADLSRKAFLTKEA